MKEPGYPEGDLLDINDAAEYISVSSKSIRRYIQSGKLRGRKVRNVWFLPRAELDKYLERERPPAQAPVAAEAAGPQAAAVIVPAFDPAAVEEIKSALGGFAERLSEIDRKLYLISQERENQHVRPDLIEKEQEIEFLKADNMKLIEELQRVKKEIADLRQNGPKDMMLLKNKIDENESLRATLASNERGLSLLRREAEQRDILLKQKDASINDLKEQARRLEEQNAKRAAAKTGLFGARRGAGGFPFDAAGMEE